MQSTGLGSLMELSVNYINDVYMRVNADAGISQELADFFTFKVPGYQFMPAYRNKMWDGNIRLYNRRNNTLYAGLIDYVKEFAETRDYEITIDPDLEIEDSFSMKDAKDFIKELNPVHEPRDYQMKAFVKSVRSKRKLVLSPTASGKSFIIYMLTKWYQSPTLIIVPTISLVHQMKGDFVDYGCSENEVYTIQGGVDKQTDSNIVISTWQSIHKLPKTWFDRFDVVIGDEAHLYKAKSLTGILEKMPNTPFRFGFTGTLDGTHTHKLVLEGLFGSVHQVITTKELIEQKHLADFKIKALILKYTDATRSEMKKKTYSEEIDFLMQCSERNNFIKNLALSLEGNTLILYHQVAKHGQILHNIIKEKAEEGRKVFFVHGGVDGHQREEIRAITEKESNAIIVASYGTFSTGINIRRLHNVIFASPTKSRIRTLQSIGRGLRKGGADEEAGLEAKEQATLFDIADDLTWKTRVNYTLKHFLERMKYYTGEKFPYKVHNIEIKV
jgi:superfamily II DNA or RNA helicase